MDQGVGLGAHRLFDTMILIDDLKAIPHARVELMRGPDRAISNVTWMEVIVGADPSTESDTRSYLKSVIIISLTPEVAERAAVICRTSRLNLPDSITLATAQVERSILVTRNTRDFDANDAIIQFPHVL